MASSGRYPASAAAAATTGLGGSRSFDFGSDDVLCSYDDFAARETVAKRADPLDKDLIDSRMGRPLVNIYEQDTYSKDDVLSSVEKCMKKYADNLLRSLDGIGGRLSQLENYCYKLERSIGDFRNDVFHEQKDINTRLSSLEKHLQEVHRSVQIMRDRQELVEELAKLQLGQKDSGSKKEESVMSNGHEPKKSDDNPEAGNQQLALVLPRQVNAVPILTRSSEPAPNYKDQSVQQTPNDPDRYVLSQAIVYYPQRQAPGQNVQGQLVQPELQIMQARPAIQELPIQQQPQPQQQVVAPAQPQSFSQYSQQWTQATQQMPSPASGPQQAYVQQQQAVQPQQANMQHPQQANMQQHVAAHTMPLPNAPQQLMQQLPQHVTQQQPMQSQQGQMRAQTPPQPYPYAPQQAANPTPENAPGSMPMPPQFSPLPQPTGTRQEGISFVYGGSGMPPQAPAQYAGSVMQGSQLPTQNMQRPQQSLPSQGSFAPAKGGYPGGAPFPPPPPQPNVQGYNPMYYAPGGMSAGQASQVQPSANVGVTHPGPQQMRGGHPGHPYGEMIDKAIGMGYPRDQVLHVTQRLMDSGQSVDFNALLDRLNEMGPAGPSRGW